MKLFLVAALLGPALAGSAVSAEEILSFDDVQPGMKGKGLTVFAGTEIQEFDVEILGKLPNIGPRQNLILGRCSGGPLAEAGVLSGMSGSPVYVEDRLIGAVAYSWGFATDAIAGITPIEEMLAVAELGEGSPRTAAASGLTLDDLRRLRAPEQIPTFLSARLAGLAPRAAGARRFAFRWRSPAWVRVDSPAWPPTSWRPASFPSREAPPDAPPTRPHRWKRALRSASSWPAATSTSR